MSWTWWLILLAPWATSVSAGYCTAYTPTVRFTLLRTPLMNALPSTPGPGDSLRPRANTIWTGGQFAAAAVGADPGVPGGSAAAGSIRAAAAVTAATATPANLRISKSRTQMMVERTRFARWTAGIQTEGDRSARTATTVPAVSRETIGSAHEPRRRECARALVRAGRTGTRFHAGRRGACAVRRSAAVPRRRNRRRDRHVLRQIHPFAGCGSATNRRCALYGRPPPRFRGAPGRVGISRRVHGG